VRHLNKDGREEVIVSGRRAATAAAVDEPGRAEAPASSDEAASADASATGDP
jgi:hypothetical protein